jgi:hypothetical protein
VDADLDTLATALYVKTDDLLKAAPQWAPDRPPVGIAPQLTDAELVTLAVLQALLGFTSEARWLRHARTGLRHLFGYLPKQPGYNKRLRAAAELILRVIRALATDTSLWTDDVWVIDSTPVGCGCSRQTAKRSDLAGWAEYGYCASHSRYFWGLRLHLLCTLHGLPVGFALTGAKADERQVLQGIFDADPDLVADRPGQTLIGDKNYYGREFVQRVVQPRGHPDRVSERRMGRDVGDPVAVDIDLPAVAQCLDIFVAGQRACPRPRRDGAATGILTVGHRKPFSGTSVGAEQDGQNPCRARVFGQVGIQHVPVAPGATSAHRRFRNREHRAGRPASGEKP